MKPNIEEVVITVSSLIEDLNNGLTWLKSEDVGNGSIQEKYNARDAQILAIKQHPKLVGIEPNLITFIIKDDTDNTTTTSGSKSTGSDSTVQLQSAASGSTMDATCQEVDSNIQGDISSEEEQIPQLSTILEL